VAGHIGTDNDLSSVIGVYNTQTDSFTELNFNVNEVLQGNIHQIAIAGNSIYILYGDEIDLEPLSIMKAIIP
jgi:fumarate hydratase class II